MITLNYIKKLVEQETTIKDISIKSRKREYTYTRSIYYILAKKYTKYSLEKIGNEMGKRDHATALHGINTFDNFRFQYFFKEYLKVYNDCCKILDSKDIDFKGLKTIEEVEQYYRIKHIKLTEKSHKVINNYRLKLDNLKNRNIFKEIAELDDDTLDLFEKRTRAFLNMNQSKTA